MDNLIAPYKHQILIAARILIALMFVESCADKLLHWDFYMQEMTAKKIPLAPLALAAAITVEFLGSIALVTGVGIRVGTLALAGYAFIVNFFYFDFWNQVDVAAIMGRKEFLKNLAVVGGLLVFTAIGNDKNALSKSNTEKQRNRAQTPGVNG